MLWGISALSDCIKFISYIPYDSRTRGLLSDLTSKRRFYNERKRYGLAADEAADDAFCEKLCEEYEASDEKGQLTSMEEMMKLCGMDANDMEE